MTPKADEDAALATPEFWDSRYKIADNHEKPTHEWLCTFENLHSFFSRNLYRAKESDQNPQILHLGCGDSTVPHDLALIGYDNQLCLDFSPVVIELMKTRYPVSGIEWRFGDVRDMHDVPSSSVDVAFDKSTLDAMVYGSPWNPPDEVKENADKYMDEVSRVLKDDGIFLFITFRQPHFMKPLLKIDTLWDAKMETLKGDSSFDYFGFILTKKTDCKKEI
ncbi:hypothetical protein BT63DRAFT_155403 [Microthyrium microscopicum]|uniref:Methyltransferase domain-containing protein n=1 Tax=Microthyrium microscopicum TaxID=703497 RepID=A0A6A6UNP4_9PEZI|nr:hypothetical protein BT63DRAFT_155403 [Microthyrium microscopicum]